MDWDNVKVQGRRGSWYCFASGVLAVPGCAPVRLYCLEHNEYGDETEWLLVNERLEELWACFDCIETALQEWVVYCEGGKEVPQDIKTFYETNLFARMKDYWQETK